MNLRKLLLIAALFTFGQMTVLGQENPAKQKAYEAMKAAEKAFDGIDFQVKAMQGRRVQPGQFQGRNGVIVPLVPQEMLDMREAAWGRYLQAAAAYEKFGGAEKQPEQKQPDQKQLNPTEKKRLDPAEFVKWLDAQSNFNDQAVRAKLMQTIQGNDWEAAHTLQFLMRHGTKASSYRADLLAYARSEALQKRHANIRLQVVEAAVRVDPSMKAELTQLTKKWFTNQSTYQRDLLRALEGNRYTPVVSKTNSKRYIGMK